MPPRTASPNLVLAIVCAGICLANLDLFIVNVALPGIAAGLGDAPLADMSWVLNGYAIAYAALLVFCGRLAERHRRDHGFLAGVLLFTLASAACAAATSVPSLVLFRIVQAAGAAIMTPTSISLLLAAFPPERRAAAVRTWTALGGLASALGPLLGGAIVAVDWRWIFLVNLPIGLAALAVGARYLPPIPGHQAPRPSLPAALLVTTGIAALVLAIVQGNDWGWASPRIAAALALAAAALALFVRHCRTSPTPFVDPALFRIRRFTGASLTMAPFSIAFGAVILGLALWEQGAWHWSALHAGLTVAPSPLLVPLTAFLVGGRAIARFGPARTLAAGILLFAAGFVVYAVALGPEPGVAIPLLGMAPVGIGVGLIYPTLMGTGTSALPPSAFATGSGVVNMVRQSAIAIGTALFVAIVAGPPGAPPDPAAFRTAWWTMAAIALLALLPVAAFLRHSPTPTRPEPAP